MNFINKVIGFVIAVSLVPTLVTTIDGLTGTGMALESTAAGTILDLAPLVFVAGLFAYYFYNKRNQA